MLNRFMKWWRRCNCRVIHVDTLQQVVGVRPKTQQEIAQDILFKYGYCTVHLVQQCDLTKQLANTIYGGNRFLWGCPKCSEEKLARRQLDVDKREAIRGIEIKYALDVLKGKDAPSS